MSVSATQAAQGGPLAHQNELLASVPFRELEPFRSGFVRVPLVHGQLLAERGAPLDHAYFIEHGTVSLVSEPVDGEEGVQVAMVGWEGMVGGLTLLDLEHSALAKAVVQSPGAALRVGLRDLHRAVERSPALQEACIRFSQSLVHQIVQTAACNARRSLVERCARWLTMTHDRVEGNELRVTHEALSAMLGVRRAGVTVAAAALQGAGLIRANRGRITVLDRAGLQGVARGGAQFPVPAPRPRPGARHGAHPAERSAAF